MQFILATFDNQRNFRLELFDSKKRSFIISQKRKMGAI